MFRKIVYIIWLNEGQCIRNSRNKAKNLIQSSRNQGELYINPPWIAPKHKKKELCHHNGDTIPYIYYEFN